MVLGLVAQSAVRTWSCGLGSPVTPTEDPNAPPSTTHHTQWTDTKGYVPRVGQWPAHLGDVCRVHASGS